MSTKAVMIQIAFMIIIGFGLSLIFRDVKIENLPSYNNKVELTAHASGYFFEEDD